MKLVQLLVPQNSLVPRLTRKTRIISTCWVIRPPASKPNSCIGTTICIDTYMHVYYRGLDGTNKLYIPSSAICRHIVLRSIVAVCPHPPPCLRDWTLNFVTRGWACAVSQLCQTKPTPLFGAALIKESLLVLFDSWIDHLTYIYVTAHARFEHRWLWFKVQWMGKYRSPPGYLLYTDTDSIQMVNCLPMYGRCRRPWGIPKWHHSYKV